MTFAAIKRTILNYTVLTLELYSRADTVMNHPHYRTDYWNPIQPITDANRSHPMPNQPRVHCESAKDRSRLVRLLKSRLRSSAEHLEHNHSAFRAEEERYEGLTKIAQEFRKFAEALKFQIRLIRGTLFFRLFNCFLSY